MHESYLHTVLMRALRIIFKRTRICVRVDTQALAVRVLEQAAPALEEGEGSRLATTAMRHFLGVDQRSCSEHVWPPLYAASLLEGLRAARLADRYQYNVVLRHLLEEQLPSAGGAEPRQPPPRMSKEQRQDSVKGSATSITLGDGQQAKGDRLQQDLRVRFHIIRNARI